MQRLRSSLPEAVPTLQSIFSSKDWVSCVRLNCSAAPSTGLHCPQGPVSRNCTRKRWMKGKEVMVALDIEIKDLQGWIRSKQCLVGCFQQDPLKSCVTSTLDAAGDRWCLSACSWACLTCALQVVKCKCLEQFAKHLLLKLSEMTPDTKMQEHVHVRSLIMCWYWLWSRY